MGGTVFDELDFSGRSASQIVHLLLALSGLVKLQVEHVQVPEADSGLMPAATQLNPPEGVGVEGVLLDEPPNLNPPFGTAGGTAEVSEGAPHLKPPKGGTGRTAVALLLSREMFVPPQLNPPAGGAGGVTRFFSIDSEGAPGRGVSHIVHFSFSEAGF